MTHYILTQMSDGPAAINRYCTAIAEGQKPEVAFLEAFGTTPAELDKTLRSYVNRRAFSLVHVDVKDPLRDFASEPPRTMTQGEANAWLGDLQRRVGRTAEAAARIESAVKADPSASIGYISLGLLRVSQQRGSEALDALQHAAQMAPDDFLTQFLHGTWLMRIDRSESAPTLDKASAALKRAVAANPNSADAYGWLAYAQMLSESTLVEARASIEKAIELAPGRIEYRLRWADIRILQGSYDDAKTLLTRIAAIKTDPDAAGAAEQRLDRLAKYEQAEALRQAARVEAEALTTGRGAAPSAPSSRSAEPAANEPPRDPDRGVELVLRKVGDGEERAYGRLLRVECVKGEVRFHVQAADRTVIAVAKKIEDVELTQFMDVSDFSVGCGPRAQPESVYLTWRRDGTPADGRVGVAVALEFLPPGYIP